VAGPDDERARRLAFAIPPIDQPPDELELEWLERADPDDRALLISAAHPELDVEAETAFQHGEEIDPRLHLTFHEIVATQLADDDPPEVWATAQRLQALGYGHHEVLHMLMRAMTGEMWHTLRGERGYDLEAHRAALAALPDSWERERPGGPALPPSRASHAKEAKRRRQAARAARRHNRRR
jgi:hypothetical protein